MLPAALAEGAAARGWGVGPQVLGSLGPSDVVAVIRGPGSFTGLRVGVAAAKALAWTTGARLVGVSGFDVLARRAARIAGWHDEPIAIAYDAGRGDVFAATAKPTADGWMIAPAILAPLDAWLESLPAGGRVTGPALEAASERITARNDLAVASPEAWHPLAAEAAAIARARAVADDVDDPHTLLPDYLRPSYAEERKPPAAG